MSQKLSELIEKVNSLEEADENNFETHRMYMQIFEEADTKKEGAKLLLNKTEATKSNLKMIDGCPDRYVKNFDSEGSYQERDSIKQEDKRIVRQRDEYMCVFCGLDYDVYHHIIPVSSGGCSKPYNLALLCSNCHSEIHYNWKFDGDIVPYETVEEFWVIAQKGF